VRPHRRYVIMTNNALKQGNDVNCFMALLNHDPLKELDSEGMEQK